MPEQRHGASITIVTYVCDKCGHGTLEWQPSFNAGDIEWHECSSCHRPFAFKNRVYPHIIITADDGTGQFELRSTTVRISQHSAGVMSPAAPIRPKSKSRRTDDV